MSYKTFQIASPLTTHYRRGTCDEVNCIAQQRGWRTVIDESTELGQRQAHYIRKLSGRKFVESREPDGTHFVFESGQQCFAEHKVSLERPAFFFRKQGDWRYSTNPFRYDRADQWVDDFATHQDNLARIANRG